MVQLRGGTEEPRIRFVGAMMLNIVRSNTVTTAPPFMFLLALFFSLSFLARAQPSQEAPGELIRSVIRNELRMEDQDHSHWMFRLKTESKNKQLEVDEVVETENGDLKRPVLINGRDLTEKQQQESDRQIDRLLQ